MCESSHSFGRYTIAQRVNKTAHVTVSSAGMASSPVVQAQLKRSGLAALAPAEGLDALSTVLSSAASGRHVAKMSAVPADWRIILKQVCSASEMHSWLVCVFVPGKFCCKDTFVDL